MAEVGRRAAGCPPCRRVADLATAGTPLTLAAAGRGGRGRGSSRTGFPGSEGLGRLGGRRRRRGSWPGRRGSGSRR